MTPTNNENLITLLKLLLKENWNQQESSEAMMVFLETLENRVERKDQDKKYVNDKMLLRLGNSLFKITHSNPANDLETLSDLFQNHIRSHNTNLVLIGEGYKETLVHSILRILQKENSILRLKEYYNDVFEYFCTNEEKLAKLLSMNKTALFIKKNWQTKTYR